MLELDEIRVEATEKFLSQLSESQWDAAILVGYDNVQYAGGAFLPFLPYRTDMRVAVIAAKDGKCAYVCPKELVSSCKKLGRLELVYGYSNKGTCPCAFTQAIADIFAAWETPVQNVAIDMDRCSHSLFGAFQKALPETKFIAADKWMIEMRQVKTDGEIRLLSDVAYVTDHAINGCLHHTMGNQPRGMLSLAEEFRIHAMERGLYETGYNSYARITGHEANQSHWPICDSYGFNYGFSPVAKLHAEDLVKIRQNATSQGYWSNACRMFLYKPPTAQWDDVYSKWLAVRNYMVSIIKPGIKCSEIYHKTKAFAKDNDIVLDDSELLGCSVGVTPTEAPFIDACDDTVLQEGMIIVISPAILEDGQSHQSNDTLKVTRDGVDVLNWWKDWREPYTAIFDL